VHFPREMSRDLGEHIDLTVLDALRQEGFFAALEKKYGKR
jgi:hypothetical protein